MSQHIDKKRKRSAYDAALDFGILQTPRQDAEVNVDMSPTAAPDTSSPIQTPEVDLSKVKVGLCQMLVVGDKMKNLDTACAAIAATVKQGAQIVVLPEMFNCPYDVKLFAAYGEPVPECSGVQRPKFTNVHITSRWICDVAERFNIYLVAGSMPEVEGGKIYNTSLVADPRGYLIAKHRKLHLFDVNIPGKIVFQESKTLSAGDQITMFNTKWGSVGLGICYDIRFPEFAQICAQKGCKMMIYPAQFNTTTGPAHWKMLLQARALDNQLFVIGVQTARNPDASYQAWGYTTVVDPWGKVLVTTLHKPKNLVLELDLDRIASVRSMIPTTVQKREDVYVSTMLLS